MYDIELVESLSQEEGLNDREISEVLGCDRTTVSRIRLRNNIAICDKRNKRDKTYCCTMCNSTIYIKRKERRRVCCEKCEVLLKQASNNIP